MIVTCDACGDRGAEHRHVGMFINYAGVYRPALFASARGIDLCSACQAELIEGVNRVIDELKSKRSAT